MIFRLIVSSEFNLTSVIDKLILKLQFNNQTKSLLVDFAVMNKILKS